MEGKSSTISFIVKGIVYLCCIGAIVIGLRYLITTMAEANNPALKEIKVTGVDGKTYTSYRTACSNGDFYAAREFVEKMKTIKPNLIIYEEQKAMEQNISEAEEYIFSNELLFLASMNEEQANKRIIYLMGEFPIEGTKQPIKKFILKSSDYGNSCNRFNTKLNTVLDIAISTGNQNLAKMILPLYKEDEILIDGGYVGAYTHDSQEAAQKKYDEAVKSGAFNRQ